MSETHPAADASPVGPTLGEHPALLALDTGGPTAGVAVFRGQILAEILWFAGRRESADLLSMVETALHLARVDKHAVDTLVVAAGPGSYSGLRIAFATATGLALGLDVGIVPIPTLDSIAWCAGTPFVSVRAAVPLGRGRYASARFHRGVNDVTPETAMESASLDELAEITLADGVLLAVDLDPVSRKELEERLAGRVAVAPAATGTRRAGALAELAEGRLRRGLASPSLVVEPLYIGGQV